MPERTRLHITPLTSDLLPLIVPASLRESATDVSFHELATYPERNYGFISLPSMDAQKLRKKVNGSILRGSKVKVEEARPKKSTVKTTVDDVEAGQGQDPADKPHKKRKRQEGVIPGYDLQDDRKVKRGWTEPVAAKIQEKKDRKAKNKTSDKSTKKQQQSSAFTDDAECLFQTTIPPNKKDLESIEKSKKQKKRGHVKTVVHEFEKTEKHPSFLRSNANRSKKPVAAYNDEQGWVDESGEVLEPKKEKNKKKSAETTSDSSPDPAPVVDHERMGSLTLKEQEGEDETSSSGSSSSGSDSDESEEEASNKLENPDGKAKISASPAPQVSVENTENNSQPAPHPLEALYKKPPLPGSTGGNERNKANLSVEAVPFSFFSVAADSGPPPTANAEASIESGALVSPQSVRAKRGAAARLPNLAIPPQTPFTQRDMMWRGQRSAAPTPDTALPGRGGFPSFYRTGRSGNRLGTDEIEEEEDEEDEEVMDSVEAHGAEEALDENEDEESGNSEAADENEGEETDDTPIKAKGSSSTSQSAFAKEFYEKRGEFNRDWKKARREAGKAQRAAATRRRKG